MLDLINVTYYVKASYATDYYVCSM